MTRILTLPIVAIASALFLLYSNALVVAAQQGFLPGAAAGVVPALLLVAVVHQIVIRRRPIVMDRTFQVMMAFLAVLLLSTFAAEGYDVAISRIVEFLLEGVLVYLLVRNAVRSLPELRVAVVAILAAAGLLAGLAVTQAVTGNYEQDFMGMAPRSLELVGEGGGPGDEMALEDRARGSVDEPNRFAQILLMAGGLGVVVALNAARGRGAILAWATVGLLLAGVLLTYSRGALVTVLVLLAVGIPLRLLRPRRFLSVLGAGAVLVVLAVPGFAGRVGSMAGVAGLFGESQVEADGPTRGRTTEMLAALAAYTDHPVLGVGPGQYVAFHSVRYQALPEIAFREIPIPRRAHNLYLEIAAETGTLGLILFLAIPMLLLRDLGGLRKQLYRRRPDLARVAAGFTLALLAYLGTGVFLHLAYERYYWVMVALTAAAVGILREWIIHNPTAHAAELGSV